ncbi:programmed cell death 6-interacting protein [Uranotaenia lowii]|uniref:programmed cell death 6-interacting protein n=1 Tax=Uranotaenia lowii TaxID=190385 RepID=UPI00247A7F9E|nr:programmed cell death 6-interacting protein [Uranotaenia lowii]
MPNFISVPLKKPYDVEIVRPLKNLIKSLNNNLGPEKLAHFENAVEKLNVLRKTAVWKSYEKQESSLESIYGYYDQLSALETKIVVQDLQIPFKWKDAFDKGSIFGGRTSMTISSMAYEKVCVMFNIAALQSAIASTQNFQSDEGLKLAAKLFQQSAGAFEFLKNMVPAAIAQTPTSDMNPDTLAALGSIMLAQSQEVFVLKAIKDNMKDLVIAKLCCQCESLYADVLRLIQKESVRNLWDKDWIPIIAAKQAGLNGLTMYYHSLVSKSNKAIGEEIAKLQKAVELFKVSGSKTEKVLYLEEYLAKAEKNLTEAKKDNDFIYNEIIPDINTLPAPPKALVVKVLAPTDPLSASFEDIFDELVPVLVNQALSTSENIKNEFVSNEIIKIREATQMLNSILLSLNLPAAIETSDNTSNLPPSLLEKSKIVRANGGIATLKNMINELPELLKRNRDILNETASMLLSESESDEQLKAKFGDKWTRIPSAKLTQTFKENLEAYKKIIDNAITADKTVQSKFESNLNGLEMLSLTEEELAKKLPSCETSKDLTNLNSANELRKLMDDVKTLREERDALESELKSVSIDMKKQFLSAFSTTGTIDSASMTVAEIEKLLAPLKERVKKNVALQESIISNIQQTHSQFVSDVGLTSQSVESMQTQLAAAFDLFSELQSNLRDGIKFYNDLTHLLVTFQSKVSDFCYARKTEKEELLRDLTQHASKEVPLVTAQMPREQSTAPALDQTTSASTTVPYPMQPQGMPLPYGYGTQYTNSMPPPMPQGFNPYATLPYPGVYQNIAQPFGFPNYGTYPGAYNNQNNIQRP